MWGVERPLRDMPTDISRLFQQHSNMLLQELLENKLEFQLVERKDGDGFVMKYEKIGVNPQWYSDLWHDHINLRINGKKRSNWRRDRTLNALTRLADGKDQPFEHKEAGAVLYAFYYDTKLRELNVQHFTQGYQGMYGEALPDVLDESRMVREFLQSQGLITNFKYADGR